MAQPHEFSKDLEKNNLPDFKSGDTVCVNVKVIEGGKERIQKYEGIVLARKGTGTNSTFTVRKISSNVGVERIFPLHSPNIDSIELLKKGKVRRSKLYYLRNRRGKSARIAERQDLQTKKTNEANSNDKESETIISEEKSAKEK